MTLQELFEIGWAHFVVKKSPPSWDGEERMCLYRGPNGTRCLIGLVIPNKTYVAGMDGLGNISSLLRRYDSIGKLFDGFSREQLEEFQWCHDGAAMNHAGSDEAFTLEIKKNLEEFAAKNHLAIPAGAA